jgi:hypothetical protein
MNTRLTKKQKRENKINALIAEEKWYELSQMQLPEDIIDKYADKLDWNSLMYCNFFSKQLVKKHFDKIFYKCATQYFCKQKIYEEIFLNLDPTQIHKNTWWYISRADISINFIKKYINYLNKDVVISRTKLDKEKIKEIFDLYKELC